MSKLSSQTFAYTIDQVPSNESEIHPVEIPGDGLGLGTLVFPAEGLLTPNSNNGSRRSSCYSNDYGGPAEIVRATICSTNKMFMADTKSRQVTLEFKDLTYKVTPKATGQQRRISFSSAPASTKTLLNNISGAFKPGELTCILGPSGAGKTTLLNILAGYRTENVEGQISINGQQRQLSPFRKLSCYIMQDVVLLEELTVQEAMGFAAQLKLPMNATELHKTTRINQILQTIGLSECLNTKSGYLSGGQKKRLAIALELITNPPIMFLDEPTSGLDSSSVLSCINVLKSLALNGNHTIIATIHQPSSKLFKYFDSVYLLSEGNCLYSGPRKLFIQFLAKQGLNCPRNYNPADFAIEIASCEYGSKWIKSLTTATRQLQLNNIGTTNVDDYVFYDFDPNKTTNAGNGSGSKFSNQFFVLLRRSFICVRRNMMLNHLRFGSTLIIAILSGLIFQNAGNDANEAFNNLGCQFFAFLFLVFTPMLVTILTFPLEREVFIREHMNYWYSTSSYYLARSLADLPFQIFFPILFTCIYYFMTNQPFELFRFNIVLLINIITSLLAQSIGLTTGAILDVQAAVFIAPLSTLPLVLFCGLFGSLSSAPIFLRWIGVISYPKYCLQSIIYALYGYDREDLPCDQPYCLYKDPAKFLESIEMNDVDLIGHITILCVMLVLLRISGYFALRYKLKNKTTQ